LKSGNIEKFEDWRLRIGLIFDDFETANYNKFDWVTGGNLPFAVTNLYPYQGNFHSASGNIGNSQTSQISLEYNVMTADSISFYRKVSSASTDKLKFYIDNTVKGEWSGTSQGWNKESYLVAPGNHTFKWVYQKDGNGTAGSDKAWFDYVVFPPQVCLTAFAGNNSSICEGENYQCNGYVYNATTHLWSTSGTGTFDDPTSLTAIYSPSIEDIEAGSVNLTLSAWDASGNMVDETMKLYIVNTPEAPATPNGPDYVDVLYIQESEYVTAGSANAVSYSWLLTPAEAGTVTGDNTIGQVQWNTGYLGYANISVSAIGDCGQGDFSEEFEVMVDNSTDLAEGQNNLLKLYPNPSNGSFTLELNVEGKQKLDIRVINLYGQTVFQELFDAEGRVTLSPALQFLSQGVYMLSVEGKYLNVKRKIIIRK